MTAQITAGSSNVMVNGIPVARVGDNTSGITSDAVVSLVSAGISGALSNIANPLVFAGGTSLSSATGVLSVSSGSNSIAAFSNTGVIFSQPVTLPNNPTSPDQAVNKAYVDAATGSVVAYPIAVNLGGTGATSASSARSNLGISTVGNTGQYSDLIDKPTSLPPSGAAGGDLSGNYPSPSVTKLNGVAANGYALLSSNNVFTGSLTATNLSGNNSGDQANTLFGGSAIRIVSTLPATPNSTTLYINYETPSIYFGNTMIAGLGASSNVTIMAPTSLTTYESGTFAMPTIEISGAVELPLTLTSTQPAYLSPSLQTNNSGNYIVWASTAVPFGSSNSYANVSVTDNANNTANASITLIVDNLTASVANVMMMSDSGSLSPLWGANTYNSALYVHNSIFSPLVGSNSLFITTSSLAMTTYFAGGAGTAGANTAMANTNGTLLASAYATSISNTNLSDNHFNPYGVILPETVNIYNLESNIPSNNISEYYEYYMYTLVAAFGNQTHQSFMMPNYSYVNGSCQVLQFSANASNTNWSVTLPAVSVPGNRQILICAAEGLMYGNCTISGSSYCVSSNSSMVTLSSYLASQGWYIFNSHLNMTGNIPLVSGINVPLESLLVYNTNANSALTLYSNQFWAMSPLMSNAAFVLSANTIRVWGNTAPNSYVATANVPIAGQILTFSVVPS